MHVDGFHRCINLILSFLFIIPQGFFASALFVVETSNCTTLCQHETTGTQGNVTAPSCRDSEYNSTSAGVAFRQCVGCELTSKFYDQKTGHTDLGWALYYMRYALDQCFYDGSSPASSAASNCVESCAPIQQSLEINLDTPERSSTYEHCVNPSFVEDATNCAKCYQQSNDQIYLANFLTTLVRVCDSIDSKITFNADAVFATEALNSNGDSNSSSDAGGMSRSAGVAIAIAVPVGVFLILSFCLVLIFVRRSKRGRRNRRKQHAPKRISSPIRYKVAEYQEPRPLHRISSRDSSHSIQLVHLEHVPPREPERIPVPRPLQTKKSGPLGPESRHPAFSENTGFEKRIDLQGPTTTPQEQKSEDEGYKSEPRHARPPRMSGLRNERNAAEESRERVSRDPRKHQYHPTHIGKSAIPLSAYNSYRETQMRSSSIISEIPTVYTAETAEVYPPRRLLAGSPFNAPSLAASGAQSNAATAGSTRRVPTSPSSRKRKSGSTTSSGNRISGSSLKKARSTGSNRSVNQLEQAIPPPSHTPRDRGFPMKTIAERATDIPPVPGLAKNFSADNRTSDTFDPGQFEFFELEAEETSRGGSADVASEQSRGSQQVRSSSSEYGSGPLFSPGREVINDPALRRATSASARASESEYGRQTSWGGSLERLPSTRYKSDTEGRATAASRSTASKGQSSGGGGDQTSTEFQHSNPSDLSVSPGTIPVATLEPVSEEPRVQRPSTPTSPNKRVTQVLRRPRGTSSPVSPGTIPLASPPTSHNRPDSDATAMPSTPPTLAGRSAHLSAPTIRPDSDISPKTLPSARFPPSPYQPRRPSENHSIDSSLMLSLSSHSNSPSTPYPSTFPPISSSTTDRSAYFTPDEEPDEESMVPGRRTPFQREGSPLSPPPFMLAEAGAIAARAMRDSPVQLIRGTGVVVPRSGLAEPASGRETPTSLPEGGRDSPSAVSSREGETTRQEQQRRDPTTVNRGRRLGEQEHELWKVRWKGKERGGDEEED